MNKNKINYGVIGLVLGIAFFVGLWVLYGDFSSSGEKFLKEDFLGYEVLGFYCDSKISSFDSSGVKMKSLGNREDQITTGLISLGQDCPNSAIYFVNILEPTKECLYSFNGEVIRLWLEGIGQEDFSILEESKKIIEKDASFVIWEGNAKYFYEFEIEKGISNMTSQQMRLSMAYEDYLKNGITESTLSSIIDYEIASSSNCE